MHNSKKIANYKSYLNEGIYFLKAMGINIKS